MSTNFYLRSKKNYKYTKTYNENMKIRINAIMDQIEDIVDNSRETDKLRWQLEDLAYAEHEEIHIGKRSWGWKPSFEVQEHFSSVLELKEFYHNNKDTYDIVDEYGEVYDWNGLVEELINWCPDGEERLGFDSYKDNNGYIWRRYEFS